MNDSVRVFTSVAIDRRVSHLMIPTPQRKYSLTLADESEDSVVVIVAILAVEEIRGSGGEPAGWSGT
jgi:hypothetical protein